MFQKTYKTLGCMEIIVFKLPTGGGGAKPYLSNGLYVVGTQKRIVSVRQFFGEPNTPLN